MRESAFSYPVEWLCGQEKVHYGCWESHFPRWVCPNVSIVSRRFVLTGRIQADSSFLPEDWADVSLSFLSTPLYANCNVFYLLLSAYVIVYLCVYMGGGVGGHDQSIILIIRSEECRHRGPSGERRLVFRKEHCCLLFSELACTSLTFRTNPNPTGYQKHILKMFLCIKDTFLFTSTIYIIDYIDLSWMCEDYEEYNY